MTTEVTIPEATGDWTTRGYDIDTLLVREIHGTLIDADRLVHTEYRTGFPNWELFRTVYAGERIHMPKLKRWVHEFGIAFATSGGVRRQVYTPTMAGTAALDALHMLVYLTPLLPHTIIAEDFGISPKAYKRFRDAIRDRLSASLNEYVLYLGSAYRQVLIYERRQQND